MRGHKVCLRSEIRKIISELSSVLPLIWSSQHVITEQNIVLTNEMKHFYRNKYNTMPEPQLQSNIPVNISFILT